ncbi:head completion/stabilization protein [Pseudomonas viridiflava]|uniref:head completion/stabilization protein n=1 Tax=Pseudomonas viridiflava TaxID=33069 RepID=UPI001F6103EE|nr:head completion/stabilization protein [Pseudomonas viridiflava]MCI3908858.1 head completion/stabilization protein [Pseudomonas viridiflava]
MSGFIASGPSVGGHINSDPFWPSIDLDALRAAQRIDSSVSAARLETAVIAATLNVNREFETWRLAQQAFGYNTLADVPANRVNGTSERVHLYLRAVHVATSAEVCERYRNYDSTQSGIAKGDELSPTIDEYRRDLRWAVRDFLGISRSTVELI